MRRDWLRALRVAARDADMQRGRVRDPELR
jgi:hypothetical protein